MLSCTFESLTTEQAILLGKSKDPIRCTVAINSIVFIALATFSISSKTIRNGRTEDTLSDRHVMSDDVVRDRFDVVA